MVCDALGDRGDRRRAEGLWRGIRASTSTSTRPIPRCRRPSASCWSWDRNGSAGPGPPCRGASSGTIRPTSRLLAPVPDPRKIICIGLNYRDHAAESGVPAPTEPVLFSKYPTALIGHGDADRLAQGEPGGRLRGRAGGGHRPRAGGTSPASGPSSMSAAMPSATTSRPATGSSTSPASSGWPARPSTPSRRSGPQLVTPDEVPDPHNLGIRLRLNGQTMQDSNTSQLIFGVDELIAYLSQVFTLEPGDLIFTGTPPGVGMARKPPVWLKPGDVVEVEIDHLGTLRNTVVAEAGRP